MLEQFLIVLSALFIYNLILKSIGVAIIKSILNSEEGQKKTEKVKKTFKERLEEKSKE